MAVGIEVDSQKKIFPKKIYLKGRTKLEIIQMAVGIEVDSLPHHFLSPGMRKGQKRPISMAKEAYEH